MDEVDRLRHRNKMLEAQVRRLQKLLAEERAKPPRMVTVVDDRYRLAAEEHWQREADERSRQGIFG